LTERSGDWSCIAFATRACVDQFGLTKYLPFTLIRTDDLGKESINATMGSLKNMVEGQQAYQPEYYRWLVGTFIFVFSPGEN
jgi:hypothetical protein